MGARKEVKRGGSGVERDRQRERRVRKRRREGKTGSRVGWYTIVR